MQLSRLIFSTLVIFISQSLYADFANQAATKYIDQAIDKSTVEFYAAPTQQQNQNNPKAKSNQVQIIQGTVKPQLQSNNYEPRYKANLGSDLEDEIDLNHNQEVISAIEKMSPKKVEIREFSPKANPQRKNPIFTLVLDSGHTPKSGGAISCSGKDEVQFNDRLVSELKPQLEQLGIRVILTRNAGSGNISLIERANIANANNADLFISIHHDSAEVRSSTTGNLQLQEIGRKGNLPIYCSIFPLRGFSVFTSRLNGNPQDSLEFASVLESKIRLKSPGRDPASHNRHGQRKQLDPKRGIYQFDPLVVLKNTKMTAILLEVAVITDREDETLAESAQYRGQVISAIVETVAEYASSLGYVGQMSQASYTVNSNAMENQIPQIFEEKITVNTEQKNENSTPLFVPPKKPAEPQFDASGAEKKLWQEKDREIRQKYVK